MRSGTSGVRPVSLRGILFLVAFVSFLALSVLGPHVHGADSTPAVPGVVTAASASDALPSESAVFAEGMTAAGPASGEQTLGFGAVCVLVLLATLALLATRALPLWGPLRVLLLARTRSTNREPRGRSFPLFRLLSISRT